MKYYLDTEFIEGFHKPLFGKKRHFIDLISIGLVCEDGSTLELISSDYNYSDADDWVKDNVIGPLYLKTVHGDARNAFSAADFHKHYGISNKSIKAEILKYIWRDAWSAWRDSSDEFFERGMKYGWLEQEAEFYAYYADYDWVVFCSLFGRMIDLPAQFPMYCRDLKQMLDEKAEILLKKLLEEQKNEELLNFIPTVDGIIKSRLKPLKNFPKQENEHSAVDDAKWNLELHKFINTLNK